MKDATTISFLEGFLILLNDFQAIAGKSETDIEDIWVQSDFLKQVFEKATEDLFPMGHPTAEFIGALGPLLKGLGSNFRSKAPFLQFQQRLDRAIDETKKNIEFFRKKQNLGSPIQQPINEALKKRKDS